MSWNSFTLVLLHDDLVEAIHPIPLDIVVLVYILDAARYVLYHLLFLFGGCCQEFPQFLSPIDLVLIIAAILQILSGGCF